MVHRPRERPRKIFNKLPGQIPRKIPRKRPRKSSCRIWQQEIGLKRFIFRHSSQGNSQLLQQQTENSPRNVYSLARFKESTDVVGDEYVFLETESKTLNLASLMKVQPDISCQTYFSRS